MNDVVKGRLGLIALVVIFALPAVFAKLFLMNNWYQSGVTNLGELIEPRVTLSALDQPNPDDLNTWQLVYVLPAQCDESCRDSLHLLKQSHIALGKYQQRVTPVVWFSETAADITAFDSVAMSEQTTKFVHAGDWIIIDPLGQLVMRYDDQETVSDAVRSKHILRDFKKLLKLSRVG